MNRHIIPAATVAAAALTGALAVAGCTSGPHDSPVTFPSGLTPPHGEPMIPATATAPGYLAEPDPSGMTLSGDLPPVASVAPDAVSIPWYPLDRDASSGAVTVNVDDGGCVSPPFGFTATPYGGSVIVSVYSRNLLPSGEACGGASHLSIYRLLLPSADAKLPLLHGPTF